MATKRVTNTEKKTTAPKRVRSTGTDVIVHAETLFSRPDHETIARRAYELFQRRGWQHGHDQEDWLTAERELSRS
jgi:hypothetical protein